ncbi:MAG: hypothetical protein Q4F05_06390 [bacterium]|nr:hypothetical protein [bacterium]
MNMKLGKDEEVKNMHRGRYNEPGVDGKDIYGIGKKAKEHMKEIKNR